VVAGFGMGCCDPLVLRGKWGKDQQAAGIEGGSQLRLQMHSNDGAGWNPDDGMAATEQDAQALPLHDRVEAADENLALVAHLGDGIEGLQDDGAGALRRAEKPGLELIERLQRTCDPELSGRGAAKACKQRLWVGWTFPANRRDLFVEDHAYSSSSSASAPRRYLMS